MILTVTLNPSVDISYKLGKFDLDTVNRVADVTKTAGGKGLNVARVLQQLDEEVSATGFLGGSLGSFIRTQLEALTIRDYFVDCKGDTRNCIAVIHEGQQTEILEGGPTIGEEQEAFLTQFESFVQQAKIVTISGSLPKGLAKDFYNHLLDIAAKYDIPVLVDTSGDSLKHACSNLNKPFLIKPNEEEIAGLLDQELVTTEALVKALQNPLFDGIEWVVVSLGKDGALIRHDGEIYQARIPVVEAVNPVGSGDSVIAGFASGFVRGYSREALIKHAMTMGVLNAMEAETGTIDPTQVDAYKAKIAVEVV